MISVFQQEHFNSFLAETGLLEPFRYTVTRNGCEVGILQGYIQRDGGTVKRFFTRRAVINGGPWLASDISTDEIESLLQRCINGLKKRVIFIELRNFADYSQYRHIFEAAGFTYEPHYNFVIDTSSAETVDTNMGKSRKRDVNASMKNGASVIENPTKDEVVEFYSILQNLYKTKVKTPLFPLSFFLQLHTEPFSKFILVKHQDEIIGGTVLVYDDETVYEWFACGKDSEFKKFFPSTVATYCGIRYSAESGHKSFDMMGAGAPGDGGYGVRDFKAKFGGILVEYGRFKHICNRQLYAIGNLGVRFIKHFG